VADVGAVGYFSRRRILDTLGLIDHHIARTPGALHLKSDVDYVLAARPEVIILVAGPDDTGAMAYRRMADQAMTTHPEFQRDYRLVQTIRLGFLGEEARIYSRPDDAGGADGIPE